MNAIVKDFKVIDTDTHVIEPYDLWTSRISVKKYGDKVPHVKWDPNMNEDAWFFGGDRTGAAAGAAMAGWHEYPPKRPQRLEQVDPALYNNTARLKKMDEYGIWAQVLYPNVAGFGAGKYLALGDTEDVVRPAHPESGRLAVFRYIADRLAAVETVNLPGDHLLARRLLANGAAVPKEAAVDPSFNLRSLL